MPEHDGSRLKLSPVDAPEGSERDADVSAFLALVRRTFDVPLALIRAIDGEVWVEAEDGTDIPALERADPFWGEPDAMRGPVVVPDASKTRRFASHRLVRGAPGIRFCAAKPLTPASDDCLGALYILDRSPRRLATGEERLLVQMAHIATTLLRQRREAGVMARIDRERDAQARLIREQAAALAHSGKIFDHSSAVAKIGVWECDLAFQSLRWTDGVYDLFELPRGSPITRAQIMTLYSPESLAEMEALRDRAIVECGGFTLDARIRTAKGNMRWMRLTANVEAENGVAVRIFGMKQDITTEKALLDRTRYLAERDTMTGLANRGLFQSMLGLGLEAAADPAPIGALLLVDLDGFKQINDTFGHALGDECLRQVAARLRGTCSDATLIARIGGDEFAVLIGPGCDRDTVERQARRIIDALGQPIPWREQSFQLGASVGLAIPEAGERHDPSALFIEADLALYAAKAAGRKTFRTFTPDLRWKAEQRFDMVKAVGEAIDEEQLDLFYQPKLHLMTGACRGFEALLRWRKPDGSILDVKAFRAAFEDPRLASRAGDWVIETALRQARAWAEAGHDFGHIAINLTAAQLGSPRFADDLVERIAEHGLRPGMIEVEMSEDALANQDPHRVRRPGPPEERRNPGQSRRFRSRRHVAGPPADLPDRRHQDRSFGGGGLPRLGA